MYIHFPGVIFHFQIVGERLSNVECVQHLSKKLLHECCVCVSQRQIATYYERLKKTCIIWMKIVPSHQYELYKYNQLIYNQLYNQLIYIIKDLTRSNYCFIYVCVYIYI